MSDVVETGTSDDAIAIAEVRVGYARARLTEALAELKARLVPRVLARNVAKGIAEKGSEAARVGVEAVKARPGVAVGAAALLGLFLARKPIGRAITGGGDADTDNSEAEETPPGPARSPARPVRKANK